MSIDLLWLFPVSVYERLPLNQNSEKGLKVGRQPLPFPLTLATESRLNVKMPPIRDLYLTSHSPALKLPCPQQVRPNPQCPTQGKLIVLKKIALKMSWLILLGLEIAKSNFNLDFLGRSTFSFLWFKKILL